MSNLQKIRIQSGDTPGGMMEVNIPADYPQYAVDIAKKMYGFNGAQYIWRGTVQSESNTTQNTSSASGGGGSVSLGDSIKFVGGIIGLGVVGVGAFITWAILPVVLSLVALILAYKYTSKFTQGKNFHVRFWLVLILTVGTPVAAFNTGTAIWNATGYTNNTAISE